MINEIPIAVPISLSVDEILLPGYVICSINFRDLPLKIKACLCLKLIKFVLYLFMLCLLLSGCISTTV